MDLFSLGGSLIFDSGHTAFGLPFSRSAMRPFSDEESTRVVLQKRSSTATDGLYCGTTDQPLKLHSALKQHSPNRMLSPKAETIPASAPSGQLTYCSA